MLWAASFWYGTVRSIVDVLRGPCSLRNRQGLDLPRPASRAT